MDQSQREYAVDLWQKIAERLNNEINTKGKFQRNRHKLWKDVLHRLDNNEWMHLIAALELAYQEDSTLFNNLNVDGLKDAIDLFNDEQEWNYWQNYNDLHPDKELASIFDIQESSKRLSNKGKMWKFMWALREVWNEARGIYLPNEDSSIGLLDSNSGVKNLTPAQQLRTMLH